MTLFYSADEVNNPSTLIHTRAVVDPGKRIDLISFNCNNPDRYPAEEFRSFTIGSWVIYDRYNLAYTGQIISIGPKTVTIDASDTGRRRVRLSLGNFAHYNHDLDLEKTNAHNTRISYTI